MVGILDPRGFFRRHGYQALSKFLPAHFGEKKSQNLEQNNEQTRMKEVMSAALEPYNQVFTILSY